MWSTCVTWVDRRVVRKDLSLVLIHTFKVAAAGNALCKQQPRRSPNLSSGSHQTQNRLLYIPMQRNLHAHPLVAKRDWRRRISKYKQSSCFHHRPLSDKQKWVSLVRNFRVTGFRYILLCCVFCSVLINIRIFSIALYWSVFLFLTKIYMFSLSERLNTTAFLRRSPHTSYIIIQLLFTFLYL